jgi:hypothetical protein
MRCSGAPGLAREKFWSDTLLDAAQMIADQMDARAAW